MSKASTATVQRPIARIPVMPALAALVAVHFVRAARAVMPIAGRWRGYGGERIDVRALDARRKWRATEPKSARAGNIVAMAAISSSPLLQPIIIVSALRARPDRRLK